MSDPGPRVCWTSRCRVYDRLGRFLFALDIDNWSLLSKPRYAEHWQAVRAAERADLRAHFVELDGTLVGYTEQYFKRVERRA